VIPEQIMTDQLEKTSGQFPLAWTNDFRGGNLAVVICDSFGNAAKELKGLDVTIPKGFRTFPVVGLDEENIRIGQRHYEEEYLA